MIPLNTVHISLVCLGNRFKLCIGCQWSLICSGKGNMPHDFSKARLLLQLENEAHLDPWSAKGNNGRQSNVPSSNGYNTATQPFIQPKAGH